MDDLLEALPLNAGWRVPMPPTVIAFARMERSDQRRRRAVTRRCV
jgi:hypothetical protein